MNLIGKTVRFRLDEYGRAALSGIAEDGEFVNGLVQDEDEIGLWIYLPEYQGGATALLRWEYFSTALLDSAPGFPAGKLPAGFQK